MTTGVCHSPGSYVLSVSVYLLSVCVCVCVRITQDLFVVTFCTCTDTPTKEPIIQKDNYETKIYYNSRIRTYYHIVEKLKIPNQKLKEHGKIKLFTV